MILPDPTRATISASQSAALFDASPYLTRFSLYHWLRGEEVKSEPSDRMRWGLALQPLVLDEAAKEMAWEIKPNFQNEYVRSSSAPIGCTVDALAVDPQIGPGVIEVKCVFNAATWNRDWQGGRIAPKHTVIQLQQQMAVGDGAKPYMWGRIAIFFAGELHYWPEGENAVPNVKLWDELGTAATQMLADVKAHREPDPFGTGVELALLKELYPVVPGDVLDWTNAPDGHKLAQVAADYRTARQLQNQWEATAEECRAHLIAKARTASRLLLPGVEVSFSERKVREHVRKASVQRIMKVRIDETHKDPLEELLATDGAAMR